MNDAAARYPDDPEVWFAVGEAGYHDGYGALTDVSDQAVLDAFDRTIALDSGFAPAYTHAVELGSALDRRERGRQCAAAYLAVHPTDAAAAGIQLAQLLSDPHPSDSAVTARLLDTVWTDVLSNAEKVFCRWPDSAYTAVGLVRAVARRPSRR